MQVQKLISQLLTDNKHESSAMRIKRIVGKLQKSGIQCHWDPPDSQSSRLLLYSGRNNQKNWELARDCNGLIIDYVTGEVICHPPELPTPPRDKKFLEQNFKSEKYDVYEAYDGTVVNMYYLGAKWRVSTARGIEMNDVKWCGMTYWQALTECGLDSKILDQKTQYTLGFSHPQMHPAVESKRLWFIQSHTGGVREWEKAPDGIAPQKLREFKSWSDIETELGNPNCCGFILRPRVMGISTVILESRRMAQLRKLMYAREFSTDADQLSVNRLDYIVVYNAMTNLDEFVKYFPKFGGDCKRVVETITQTVRLIRDGKSPEWAAEIKKIVDPASIDDKTLLEYLFLPEFAATWCKQLYPKST